MKIEAGKTYITKDGTKIGPMRSRIPTGDVSYYPFVGPWEGDASEMEYTEDRLYLVDEPNHILNLVAELPSRTEFADAVEKELESGIEQALIDTDPAPTTEGWQDFAEVGYEPLAGVLHEAHDQAALGKGVERHANGKPFVEQPILSIGRMCGLGFQTGQIQKKVQEATGMFNRGQKDAAIRELLGAINYCVAAVLLIREH